MTIAFGCHGSTWDLNYDRESDRLDDILDVVAESGFEGVDVQIALLGRYRDQPERLREQLDQRCLRLAALTVPFTWPGTAETDAERRRADTFIAYVRHFPKALLNIPPRTGPDRNDLLKRQKEIMSSANAMARRSADQGVLCSFHPSSPPTSYFRTQADYEVMFDLMDRRYLGWTPDLGHIAAGGMDAVAMVQAHRNVIRHVHIKDFGAGGDHGWRKMGTGDIDFAAMAAFLYGSNYEGWIMIEEETAESSADPDSAIRDIGRYVAAKLRPAASGRSHLMPVAISAEPRR